ncbi:hypothetical protein Ddye_024584 [Dipteronia dyeriana]|uniref:Legume lectin domain-containing protein n=1 Tax=Dipteronia dyeriana TaxID=168575 RepID=A0AAD9TV93_9ROSI|nr:hypothetical protein Ddye_024584 [Dipteronia dyeriana]
MAAAALRSLYVWISFILSFITLALAQDENQFIYNGFLEAKLHLGGNANIYLDGLLQLTNTSERQQGYAFHPSPIKFNTSSPQSLSFSTYFVFAMVPGSLNYSGHCMTFVMSPSMDFSGATVAEHLGLFNRSNNGLLKNHVLAVQLDTVVTPKFDYLSAEHVGVDVNSLISNDSALVTYFSDNEGKNKSLKLVSGNRTQVWIDYNGADKLLNVTLAPISVPKPSRPLLSTVIDLSQILLDSMYVGFTASTGTISNNHYALGWSFNRSGKANNLDVSKLPSLPSPPPLSPLSIPPQKGRQKLEPMIIVSAVALVVVLITIGGAVYTGGRRNMRKYMKTGKENAVLIGSPTRLSTKQPKILLYTDLNGKLGDFGLARLYDHGSNPETTTLARSPAYMAPELLRTGKANTSTDNRGAILEASDPRLEGLYVEEQMKLVLKLGLFCSHPNPTTRPSMRQVMQYLDGDAKFPDISIDLLGRIKFVPNFIASGRSQ